MGGGGNRGAEEKAPAAGQICPPLRNLGNKNDFNLCPWSISRDAPKENTEKRRKNFKKRKKKKGKPAPGSVRA